MEVFLLLLALTWVGFASIQDIKSLEVSNWVSFSLIIFALGFRFFLSLFNGSFMFFYQGIFGLIIFYVLGNIFYYSRLFAGGDAKLIIALGSVLGISNSFSVNLIHYSVFFMIFLFSGGVYGGIASIFLVSKNFRRFRKEFKKIFLKYRSFFFLNLFFALFLMIFSINEPFFLFAGIFVFAMPLLYAYAKAVDESCSVKAVSSSKLREGDWLYKEVKAGNKTIIPKWEGLNATEVKLIRKKLKKVKIRQGMAFVPVIFLSLVFFTFYIFLNF